MKFFTLACDCNDCGGSNPMIAEVEHQEDCSHKHVMFEMIRVFRSRELAQMESDEYFAETGEKAVIAEYEVRRV